MARARTVVVDRGWVRIKHDMLGMNGRGVKVGILANAGQNQGTAIVDYAVFNEFGTERIPARPFMRKTVDDNMQTAMTYAAQLVSQAIGSRRISADVILDRIGLWYQARIRETIRNAYQWAAPNAPATIARKGSDKPLIDTGMMHGAVNYEKVRI